MQDIPKKPDPIFILGIMYRSGTNFLHDLICLHPDCVDGGIIKEDFLLYYTNLIVEYVNSVYSRWNPRWQVNEKIGSPDVLVKFIGDSLLHYLNLQKKSDKEDKSVLRYQHHTENPDRGTLPYRLVTKTPSVNNLQNFPRLFPNAKLVVIVRDGRAVVESGVRSFNWTYEKAIHNWKRMARVILSFKKNKKEPDDFLLIRYEDLFRHTELEMRKIFLFVGLDESKYDFETARDLPVKGSSDIRKKETQQIHWYPIEKPLDFDPLARFKDWGLLKHERFNWIAGKELEAFGYVKISSNRFFPILYNLVMDLLWRLSTAKSLIVILIQRGKRYVRNRRV